MNSIDIFYVVKKFFDEFNLTKLASLFIAYVTSNYILYECNSQYTN